MTPILVTGARGMLGHCIGRRLADRQDVAVTAVDRTRCDLRDPAAIDAVLDEVQPRVVYHCAAMTGVDACERDYAQAVAVNAAAPGRIARWCAAHAARMVHVSTDYVFDGTARSPIEESAPTGPLGAYGRSKLLGEKAVVEAGGGFLLVRTAWVYAERGRNFALFVLDGLRRGASLPIVTDQVGCPTYADDLAGAILALVDCHATGVYHVVNDGQCNWMAFAEHLQTCAGLDGTLRPIRAAELNRPAPRPSYSVLSCAGYREITGQTMRHWRDAAADCVRRWQETSVD